MNEHSTQWQQNWHRYWSQYPRYHPGLSFAMPFLSLLRGLVTFVWLFAFISLLTSGAVFGIPLPAGLPVWAGIILLIVAYNLLIWPIKAIRHAYYYHGAYGPRYSPVFFGLWDTLVWLGFLTLLVWLADRYVPQAHQAIMNLPPAIHSAAENVKLWWARQ